MIRARQVALRRFMNEFYCGIDLYASAGQLPLVSLVLVLSNAVLVLSNAVLVLDSMAGYNNSIPDQESPEHGNREATLRFLHRPATSIRHCRSIIGQREISPAIPQPSWPVPARRSDQIPGL